MPASEHQATVFDIDPVGKKNLFFLNLFFSTESVMNIITKYQQKQRPGALLLFHGGKFLPETLPPNRKLYL